MKIKAVKSFSIHPGWRKNWIFVKVETDEGIEGWGEAYTQYDRDRSVMAHLDELSRYMVGRDPFEIKYFTQMAYDEFGARRGSLEFYSAVSGIETALWDVVGKALGQPVYNLLGGKVRDKIRVYANGWSYKMYEPDDFARAAVGVVEQGFTAVKFDPIMPMSAFDPRQLSLEALDNAELVVKNVREAVGSRCDLLIGTHGQMTTAAAIRLAKRLEKFDPLWFEEPVPPENTSEMSRVARSTSIPVATGERLATKYEFVDLLEKQAAAILQPALARVGGILEAKKIAGMAEAHYVQIAPHLYCGPIEAAANIQIATCSPNFLIQESIENFTGFYAEILKEPIKWEDGFVIPPDKPGLGIELNEAVAAANPYTGPVFPEMVDKPVWPR